MSRVLSCVVLISVVVLLQFVSAVSERRDRSFYYGTWLDSAQYNEMQRTKSPFSSRKFVSNQIILHSLPEGTRYFGWSDGLDYVDSAFVGDTLTLKCPDNLEYTLTLKIVDDSTLSCDQFLGDTTIVLRRMVPIPPPDNRPLEWFFEQKYFKGAKRMLTVATNTIAKVTFADSGKVINSAEWKQYGTCIGEWEGLPPYDILWLTTVDDSVHCLSYELAGDTILVYELLWKDESGKTHKATGDWQEPGVYRGALKYMITARK